MVHIAFVHQELNKIIKVFVQSSLIAVLMNNWINMEHVYVDKVMWKTLIILVWFKHNVQMVTFSQMEIVSLDQHVVLVNNGLDIIVFVKQIMKESLSEFANQHAPEIHKEINMVCVNVLMDTRKITEDNVWLAVIMDVHHHTIGVMEFVYVPMVIKEIHKGNVLKYVKMDILEILLAIVYQNAAMIKF